MNTLGESLAEEWRISRYDPDAQERKTEDTTMDPNDEIETLANAPTEPPPPEPPTLDCLPDCGPDDEE